MITIVPRSPTLRRRVVGTAAALLLGTTMLTGAVVAGVHASAQAATVSTASQMPGSFADLVAKVTPAVVNVSTTSVVSPERAIPPLPFPPGSPFGQFFRHFQEQQQGAAPEKLTALGSGFIIDPSGYIVTNNHVIDGNDATITVKLQDGTELPAKLVGRDVKTDLALLKVNAKKPLPYVQWGNSDQSRVGDWVVAVGNPFGLGGTVTAGIISARGRDIHSGPYDDFLQIDASINRGNSGGPTFNTEGQVIGINTAIYSPNGGSVGIGFAIPSDLAAPVIAQLKAHGHVERGWLGVEIQTITPAIADSLGLKSDKGALVASVTPDSPAAKAGLKQGDVITAFNNEPIAGIRDLTRAVAAVKPGTSDAVQIQRQGKTQTLDAKIEQMPEQIANAGTTDQSKPSKPNEVLGMQLSRLDKQSRQQLGLDNKVKGVLVVGINDNSNSADVQPGDVIVKIGNEPVTTPTEVKKLVDQAKSAGRKAVLMLIDRNGEQHFVALSLKQA